MNRERYYFELATKIYSYDHFKEWLPETDFIEEQEKTAPDQGMNFYVNLGKAIAMRYPGLPAFHKKRDRLMDFCKEKIKELQAVKEAGPGGSPGKNKRSKT